MRGAQSIGQRLAFRETLRALVTSLPDRRDVDAGTATGVAAGFRWRLDIVAVRRCTFVDPQAPSPWQPSRLLVITVRSPSGQQLQINTTRLAAEGRDRDDARASPIRPPRRSGEVDAGPPAEHALTHVPAKWGRFADKANDPQTNCPGESRAAWFRFRRNGT